jgi:AcrR family transcriptional regulator
VTENETVAEYDLAHDEKVDRIVEIAQARFDHFGYKKTTMAEIARDAGVSKKTIYEYFPSKEALFSFVMDKVALGIKRGLVREIEGEPDTARRLERLLTLILERSAEYHRSEMSPLFTPVESLAEQAFKHALRPLLAELIAQGMEENLFVKNDPGLAADLIGSVVGQGVELLKTRPIEVVAPQVIQLALGGLKKRGDEK